MAAERHQLPPGALLHTVAHIAGRRRAAEV
jgi:hypothetical protein